MSSPQTSPTPLTTPTKPDFEVVADEIRNRSRFLVTTHENPDGDALGSMLALHLALEQLGKDSSMYLAGDAPLPSEYKFMPLGGLRRQVPDDCGARPLAAVDFPNESRIGPDPAILAQSPL